MHESISQLIGQFYPDSSIELYGHDVLEEVEGGGWVVNAMFQWENAEFYGNENIIVFAPRGGFISHLLVDGQWEQV